MEFRSDEFLGNPSSFCLKVETEIRAKSPSGEPPQDRSRTGDTDRRTIEMTAGSPHARTGLICALAILPDRIRLDFQTQNSSEAAANSRAPLYRRRPTEHRATPHANHDRIPAGIDSQKLSGRTTNASPLRRIGRQKNQRVRNGPSQRALNGDLRQAAPIVRPALPRSRQVRNQGVAAEQCH